MIDSALERARMDFLDQAFMAQLGARLASVERGAFAITLPVRPGLTQQNGFVHAGALASVLDTACGFAALTTVPPDRTILTAEFKINLFRPAIGTTIEARAEVVREGRSLVVCQAVATACGAGGERDVALMTATLASVPLPGAPAGAGR